MLLFTRQPMQFKEVHIYRIVTQAEGVPAYGSRKPGRNIQKSLNYTYNQKLRERNETERNETE